MNCGEDLEFHDDSGRAEEKAKESILLMKKKMLRSHDLILQYNNKLKECERLKGDLCIVQEEAIKLRKENNASLTKVATLESQSTEYKKCRQDLENQIAEKDIRIASDKCHLQQLICKVEDIEEKHAQKLMEVELEKSSVEVKVKDLEQELKALRKSHLAEIHKLEKAIHPLPTKPRRGTIKGAKDTKEVGVNTTEEIEIFRLKKPTTADKCILTNEFYHITDNPYPIFCDKCELSIEPSAEKICKIMTKHPPLLTEMLSPTRHREIPSVKVPRTSQDTKGNSNNYNTTHNDFYRNNLNPKEVNLNEFNRVDEISRNFVSPIEPLSINGHQTNSSHTLDTSAPEIEILRRKVETLERKIKKRKKEKNADTQPTSANCCGHSKSVNCCGYGRSQSNAVPNAVNNVQPDMMTEFWNRLMKFTNGQAPKVESPRNPKKQSNIKLRRLKKIKINVSRKTRNCGSTNWEIESDDCDSKKNIDNYETNNSHILRIRPVGDESRQSSSELPNNIETSSDKKARMENSSNCHSPVKVPDKAKRKRKLVPPLDESNDEEIEVDSSMKKVVGTSNLEGSITDQKVSGATPFSDVEFSNLSQNSESAYFSQNSAVNGSASKLPSMDLQSKDDESILNSEVSPVDSNADRSDTNVEEHCDADLLPKKRRGRKRKRSNSPRTTSITTQSKLMGKLRALKKNSITGVVKTSLSNVRETRSRRKVNYSEIEEPEVVAGTNERASSESENEADTRVPTTKQRIAHVPKTEKDLEEQQTSRTTKLRQICRESEKKSNKRENSSARRLILIEPKCEEKNSTNGQNDSKSENLGVDLPNAPPAKKIARRGRPPGKRNSTTRSSTNSLASKETTVESKESAENPTIAKLENPDPPKCSSTSSNLESSLVPREKNEVFERVTEDRQKSEKIITSLEDKPYEENNQILSKITEKISKSSETQLSKLQENSGNNPAEKNLPQFQKNSETTVRKTSLLSQILSAEEIKSVHLKSMPQSDSALLSETLNSMKVEIDQTILQEESSKSLKDKSETFSVSMETHDEPETNRAPPTGTEKFDSPASPGSSSPLEVYQMTPTKTAVSPIVSPLYSNFVLSKSSISSKTLEEETASRLSPATNAEESSKVLPGYRDSILFAKLTEGPGSSGDSAKIYGSSPSIENNLAQSSNANDTTKSVSKHKLPAFIGISQSPLTPKNRLQRSSFCENFVHPIVTKVSPISPNSSINLLKDTQIITSTSTPSNNIDETTNSTSKICDRVERDSSLTRSSPEKCERQLVVYDNNLQDNIDSEFDSNITSSPQFSVDTYTAKRKNKSLKSLSKDCVSPGNVVKELRSRQVLSVSAAEAKQYNRIINNIWSETSIHWADDCTTKILNPKILLGRHLREQRTDKLLPTAKMRSTAAAKLQMAEEKTVEEELNKLVESEEWTSELQQSVIAKLRGIRSHRTVAKSIVDFVVERSTLEEPLDRTHTPPAPVMTRTQQRIAALINGLDRDGTMPGISDLVQNGIEYIMFRLNFSPEIEVVEGLTRLLTAIARMKKDRERVRILCLDSLYCIGRKAMTVIFTVLSMWPEVFPMHGTCTDELPNCIAHLIKLDASAKEPANKAVALRTMITEYYKYPQFLPRSNIVMTGLMKALQSAYSSELEASILLLAKREGTDWAHDNIINGDIMKMIDDKNYPSGFNVLNLLGFIARTFPLADTAGVVRKIFDKLYKIMESGEASVDQQEGAISALLSLSRHIRHFEEIAEIVLKWTPGQALRTQTIEQMNSFFKMRASPWWFQRHPLNGGNIDTRSNKSD